MPCVAPRTPSAAAVRNSAAPVRPFGPVGAPTHLLRPAESGQKSQEKPPQATPKLEEFDPIQVALLKEECIVIDENDKAIGTGSKKDCHLMTNIRDGEFDLTVESGDVVFSGASSPDAGMIFGGLDRA